MHQLPNSNREALPNRAVVDLECMVTVPHCRDASLLPSVCSPLPYSVVTAAHLLPFALELSAVVALTR